ncbi:hypothetical protein [Streptomyces sp. NPDC058451]|uniref:hypothetical protein n=1 Tax=Streptomyces sp. NPDC058451 TaxID=3346506 RepID=UPI00365DCD84
MAEAARFDGQLTAFGEMLATHPFATDRPGTTHVMAVEYARALDAYEKAEREATRDPALARRELDEGLASLNRLNNLLVGGLPAEATVPEPRDRTPPATKNAASPGETEPAASGPTWEAADRSKPRLRDRFAPEQLMLRAGLTALAVYSLAVGIVAGWQVAIMNVVFLNVGLGMAGGGFVFCLMPILQTWGAVKGGRVEADYRCTEKSFSSTDPWEQHYVHVDADGRELTYRRKVPTETLAPLPTRRLWLVKGKQPELITSTSLFLTPLMLILGIPLLLGGTVATLFCVPGALIGALTGHDW